MEVKLKIKDEFPVPQDDGYAVLESMSSYQLSWKGKALALDTSIRVGRQHAAASLVVPVRGWATKESCRRAGDRFSPDVVATLRWCFDAVPRLNNYQTQNELRKKFKIGPKVLRISQISGWVTSEVKRRKNAAMAATADLANMMGEAAEKGEELSVEDELQVGAGHVGAATGAGLASVEINEVVLCEWKRKWRWQLHERHPELREHKLMAAEDAAQQQLRQQLKRERLRQQKLQEKEGREQLRQQKQQEKEGREQLRQQLRQQKQQEKGEGEQLRQQKRRKQPAGTEHCWHCWADVLVADYNYNTERCNDKAMCDLRAGGNSNKRRRTKNKQYGL